jgi:hypothetical protein
MAQALPAVPMSIRLHSFAEKLEHESFFERARVQSRRKLLNTLGFSR